MTILLSSFHLGLLLANQFNQLLGPKLILSKSSGLTILKLGKKKRNGMAPNLYIVAGPNGVGKTTFAREFLPNYAS